MTDKRFNASQAHRLDAPERLLWLPPAEVVHALGIAPGESIADIGAGTGYFSLPMASQIGPRGIVYGVDAQDEMLVLLRKRVSEQGSANIRLVRAEADHTGLPDASCDLVFMANVWHEFPDRPATLRESLRILKRPGRVAILDWRPDVEREAGPPLEHRIGASLAADALRAAGFAQITERHIGKFSWLVQGKTGEV